MAAMGNRDAGTDARCAIAAAADRLAVALALGACADHVADCRATLARAVDRLAAVVRAAA